jgi:hypothetical protein
MAEEEKGAKWWFRYVIVPIIGGGGIIALISSHNGQSPAPQPPTQLGSQDSTQPAKTSFAFTIYYYPEKESPLKATEGSTVVTLIKIYVDDLILETIETDQQSEIDGDFTVSTLGKHRYNITGVVIKKVPSGQISKTDVEGGGTIYVQDGSEFRLVLDHAAAHRPNRATMKLERAY